MEPGPPQVGIATGMCAFIHLPVLALGFTISDNPKVIPHPVDTQSSAEHLIGVKTMSDAFRGFWVSWAVAKHSKNNSENPKGPDRDADKVIECELNGCLGKAGPRVASSGKHH